MADGGASARRVARLSARWRAVGGSARVVDHVDAGGLVTGRVRFNRIPVEQGERLVEIGHTAEVREETVGHAAVFEPDFVLNQRNSRTAERRDASLGVVDERAGVDVRLPLLNRNVSQIEWLSDHQVGGRRQAIHDLIVPLVEDGDSPTATGKTVEGEGPIGGALGEREVLAVRIAKAHEALGPEEGIARTA